MKPMNCYFHWDFLGAIPIPVLPENKKLSDIKTFQDKKNAGRNFASIDAICLGTLQG